MQIGLEAFAELVSDWSDKDIRTLADLLVRLEEPVGRSSAALPAGGAGRRSPDERHRARALLPMLLDMVVAVLLAL